MHISFEYFPLRALTANSSVAGFGGSGRCRRARPSNSDNQQQKQPLALHSPGARERCTLALSHTSMCAVCFENWCSTFVLSCSVHSSVGCAPRVAVRPSLCSGPALPLFVGLLLVTLFRTRVYYKRKLIFLKLFRNCLNTVTAFCLKANFCVLTKRHVLYTLHFA